MRDPLDDALLWGMLAMASVIIVGVLVLGASGAVGAGAPLCGRGSVEHLFTSCRVVP